MRTHHEFDPRRFIPAPPGIEREYASFFSGQMADPDVVILVAEHDGEVLGYSYAVINWSFLQLRSKKEVNEHLAKRRAA